MEVRRSLTCLIVIALMGLPDLAGAAGYVPDTSRIRSRLAKPAAIQVTDLPAPSPDPLKQPTARVVSRERDSVWNGLLIGAGVGAGAGYVWARSQCGSNDAECSAIANPVGIIVGGAIGAAVGAILDAFSH
jgi:hypothetical protein